MLLDMVVAKKFESENFFNNPNERVLQTLVSVDKVDNLIVVAEDTEEIANEFYNKDDWYKYTAGLILNLNTEACTKDDYYLKIHEITSAQVSNQIPSILLEKVNAYQREHDEPELDNVNQIEFNQFFSKEDAETVLNYIDLCSRFRDDIASQNYYLVPCSILNSFTRIDPDDHDILECDTAYIVDRYDEKRFYDELSEDLNYFCSRPDRCYELSKLDDPLEYSDSYRLCSDTFNYQVFKNKIDFENEMLKRQSLGDYLLLNKDQRANAVIPLLSFDGLDLSEQDSFIQDLMETIEEVGLDKTAKLSPCYAELIDYSRAFVHMKLGVL